MKIAKRLLSLVLLGAGLAANAADAPIAVDTAAVAMIQGYSVTSVGCHLSSQSVIMIRKFDYQNVARALIVEPEHLLTSIVDFKDLTCTERANPETGTAYGNLLDQARLTDATKKDSGITRSEINKKIFLTVDLCPSHHSFEKDFFDWVRKERTPVALSISGSWMDQHKDELEVLKELAKTVPVTWVNHTLTHPYIKKLPDAVNFLMLPGTNISDEILGNEKKMIENGLIPSVFFRFPGLMSNQPMNDQVVAYGLIPIGSDAWLALGEKPKEGSIILVHGNGNEPYGIRLFFRDLSDLFKMGFAPITSVRE